MEQEVSTLLRKEAIEVVPPLDKEYEFYSRTSLFLGKGLRPTLGLSDVTHSDVPITPWIDFTCASRLIMQGVPKALETLTQHSFPLQGTEVTVVTKRFCSARAHTSLSLSLSLARSLHLFSFCSAHSREKQRFNSVKHRYYFACISNFTWCKNSRNHIHILCVFDFIKRRLVYQDFLCRLTYWKWELVI